MKDICAGSAFFKLETSVFRIATQFPEKVIGYLLATIGIEWAKSWHSKLAFLRGQCSVRTSDEVEFCHRDVLQHLVTHGGRLICPRLVGKRLRAPVCETGAS